VNSREYTDGRPRRSSQLRALFAIKSLKTVGGGAEKVFAQVVGELDARGHELVLLTFDPDEDGFYPIPEHIHRVHLDLGQVGESLPRVQLLRALPRLRRAISGHRPDVVVAFMHSMYVPVAGALASTRVPLIASEHAPRSHFQTRPLERMIAGLASRRSCAITVPSAGLRGAYPDRLRRRVVVVPNPVAIPREPRRSEEAPPTVLAVGRLSEEKNHTELVAAFARVAPQFPSWRLVLVGDGDLREELAAQVQHLGLDHRISLPGPKEDVAACYARAALVAMPSRYESFGLVTAEALAAGRPVVGFADCPGTNELIEHEVNGLLVSGDGDRVGALADGLRRLMADRGMRDRLGQAGPDSVAAFGLEQVTDNWEQLLLRCAAQRGSG
jgi:glycosyltransferase involved in cell wall biosynthesis